MLASKILSKGPEERKGISIADTNRGDESTKCEKQQMDGMVFQEGKYWWAYSIVDTKYFLIQCFGRKKCNYFGFVVINVTLIFIGTG